MAVWEKQLCKYSFDLMHPHSEHAPKSVAGHRHQRSTFDFRSEIPTHRYPVPAACLMPGWQWRWQQHTAERSALLQLIGSFAVGLLCDVQGVGMFKLQDFGGFGDLFGFWGSEHRFSLYGLGTRFYS